MHETEQSRHWPSRDPSCTSHTHILSVEATPVGPYITPASLVGISVVAMDSFPCQVEVSTLDRRRRFRTKKTYEHDSSFSVRRIASDNSFHMEVQSGAKKEVFISSKLRVSDNIATLRSIALEIPEFRSLVVIHELPAHAGVLEQILDVLMLKVTTKVVSDECSADKENRSCLGNQLTSEERCSEMKAADKKKPRSPLKSDCTPTKKKDRLSHLRTSPVKLAQPSCFFTGMNCFDTSTATVSADDDRIDVTKVQEGMSPANVILTQSQLDVLERCKDGQNVFLTGGAGTGKSHLLKCIVDEMVNMHGKQRVFVTATTGIAAVNIGGTTIHQFAGIHPGDKVKNGDSFKQAFKNQSVVRRWRQAQVLVVDEISMLSPRTLELINSVAQDARGTTATMGGVQVIFSGDFFQLPPVDRSHSHNPLSRCTSQTATMTQTEATQNQSTGSIEHSVTETPRFCFQSDIWNEIFSRNNCFVLNVVHRQKDQKFSELLNAIRWGICSDEVCGAFQGCVGKEIDSSDGILPTKIFTHRRDVNNLNSVELKKLTGECRRYKAVDDGEKTYVQMLQNHCPAKQEIVLKLGAQVVLLKSIDPSQSLVNGSRGVIVDFTKFEGGICRKISNESFPILLGGRVVAQRYQIPLDLAWGISVHKSQGISVDKAVLYIKNCFEYGQAYVALSRVKTIEGLSLTHNLSRSFIKAHPDVKQFYKLLQREEEL